MVSTTVAAALVASTVEVVVSAAVVEVVMTAEVAVVVTVAAPVPHASKNFNGKRLPFFYYDYCL